MKYAVVINNSMLVSSYNLNGFKDAQKFIADNGEQGKSYKIKPIKQLYKIYVSKLYGGLFTPYIELYSHYLGKYDSAKILGEFFKRYPQYTSEQFSVSIDIEKV